MTAIRVAAVAARYNGTCWWWCPTAVAAAATAEKEKEVYATLGAAALSRALTPRCADLSFVAPPGVTATPTREQWKIG